MNKVSEKTSGLAIMGKPVSCNRTSTLGGVGLQFAMVG